MGTEVKALIPPQAAALLPQLREHKSEIIELLSRSQPRPSDMAAVELLADEIRQWDDALHLWSQARCTWRERSQGSVSALYVDHIEHAHQTGGMFAPDVETFRAVLMALGFTLSADGSMVNGLVFKDDDAIAREYKSSPMEAR